MNNASNPFYKTQVQNTLKIGVQMDDLIKQRDALRGQREALDLAISEAEMRQQSTLLVELREHRAEVHGDWSNVVMQLEQLRKAQQAQLQA